MRAVYNVRLGRYIGSLTVAKEPVFMALASSPLLAKGHLEDYTFPLSAEAGAEKNWACKVHNAGTKGTFGFGIVNPSGNPGNVVIKWGGQEYIVEPGIYWRVFIRDAPNCTRITQSGKIVFTVEGTFNMKLWAMHEDGGTWYYDEEQLITVPVGGAPPDGDGWQVTKTVHVYDHFPLKSTMTDRGKWDQRKIVNVDMSVLVGGRLDYVITCTRGTEIQGFVKLLFNEVTHIDQAIRKGDIIQGSVDVTGYVKETNVVRIFVMSGALVWLECEFDVVLKLGYSEEPAQDPGTGFQWPELAWWQWGLIGAGALGTLWIVTSKPQMPPIIIAPGGR